ncbi:EAL domain-containing protein [Aliikangiella maris]|uniref:EAL domain-containing protein n=2 Tax=Aliikangiella maris TaxID=3162458 RepID=A0ABV2BRI0_9GAMM
MKLGLFKYLIWLLVTTFSLTIKAETSRLSTSLLKQTSLKHYSTEQGLSQNTVKSFYQDQRGYIWIATDSGLNRLDGNQITIFDGPDNLLIGDAITFVREDSEGALWISTLDELLYFSKDYQQVEHFYFPDYFNSLPQHNQVIEIIEHSTNHFWVVTQNGLFILSPQGKEIVPIKSAQILIDNRLHIFKVVNQDHAIWLATNKGLFYFDKNTESIIQVESPILLEQIKINDLIHLNQQKLFIATDNGGFIIDAQSKTAPQIKQIHQNRIESAAVYENTLLMATGDKLYQYNLLTEKLIHLFSLSELLPRYTYNEITRLFLDKQQKLWLGTSTQGAYVWDPKSLNYLSIQSITQNPATQLSNNTVWGFAATTPDDIWIATDNGLNHLNLKQKQLNTYLSSASTATGSASSKHLSSAITFILNDAPYLWLASKDGLIKFDTQTKHTIHYRQQFKLNKEPLIYSMTKTPNGILWLASENGPLIFNIETEKFLPMKGIPKSTENSINTYVSYFNEQLWIGYSDKIITYDIDNKSSKTIIQFPEHKKHYDSHLTDILFDNDRLWVSFNTAGIYILDLKDEFATVTHHFNRKNGFIDNTVHSLTQLDHQIIATTHSGLAVIDANNLSFLSYNSNHGLPVNEFNEGAHYKLNNNSILFGGANGILLLPPKKLPTPDNQVTPTISTIKIQDKALIHNGINWDDRQLKIKEKESLLTVGLTTLDYLSSNQWEFEYWLSGDKSTTPKISKNHEITIANLPVGNYKLNIKAVIPNYKKFDSVTTLSFTILPTPWNENKMEKIIFLILFLGLAGYLFNRHLKNQKLIQANRKLEDKQQKLELAVLDNTRGVWEWNKHKKGINNSTLSIILANNETIVATLEQYKSYVHPDNQKIFKQAWKEFLIQNKPEIDITFKIYFFDRWIWCRFNGKASDFDSTNNPTKAIGTWLDVSQEKTVEENLKLFEQALQSTRDMIFILDAELNIVAINEAYHLHTGYDAEDLIGKNIISIVKKRIGNELAMEIESKVLNTKSWQGEVAMPINNGPSFPIDVRVDAINFDGQTTHFIMLMTDISSLNDRMENQKLSSYYDSLTGLPNRVLSKDRLSHAMSHAKAYHKHIVLIHLELDNFEFHTRTLGKTAAREIIVKASKRISNALNKDDTLARIDKNQFHIILENEDKVENVSFKINTILSALNAPQTINHSNIQPSACIGVAYYPHDATSPSRLIQRAQEAKQHALMAGSNQIYYYHKALNKKVTERLAIKSSLKNAIKNNQFYLVFQPKYHLLTKSVYGFEVFLRWRMGQDNIIYPSQFIKVAEEIGMMEELTQWLINQSLRTLAQWRQDGINTIFSIHLNPEHCKQISPTDYLAKRLNDHQLSVSNIHIEINEKHFSANLESNLKFVNELHSLGFSVILDDFGNGNTPITFLKNLPFNAIKMDRQFIRNIGKDKNNDILLQTLITMTNNLGQIPTAKGIEYEEQLDYLIKAGCQFGQGYFFSDPLSENSARNLILNLKKNMSFN